MNKKGFTLIELLAVIVILAVIALITIPILMGVIEKSRQEAFKDSVYGIEDAIDYYYLKNNEEIKYEFNFRGETGLKYKGEKMTSGKIVVDKDGNKKIVSLTNGKYCANGLNMDIKITKGKCMNDDIENAIISYINMPDEIQNGYLKQQVISLNFENKNNLVYYLKSTRKGISSVNMIKSCGEGIEPEGCTEIEATKIINENTWYISESNEVSITYNETNEEEGTIYYSTGKGSEILDIETGSIVKIDANDPNVEINDIETTKDKIILPLTISDNESGIKTKTCKYSNDTSYNKDGEIKEDKCEITGLDEGETINYQICAEDMVGNDKCKTGSATTKKELIIGQAVYFNPVLGQYCSDYVASNSNTGVKTGCMKFYVVSKTDSTASLLLDHNTTEKVNWWNKSGKDYNNPGQYTFNSDVSSWKTELNPRLLTRGEVCNIIGNIGNCTGNGAVAFDSSKYGWLMGKNYWLDDYYSGKGTSSGYKYYITTGNIKFNTIAQSGIGIRPVITISTN